MTLQILTDEYFEESFTLYKTKPRAVIIMGGPGTGKTYLRARNFSSGYVVLDAGDIFLKLCQGEYFDFPGPYEREMNVIGRDIARRIFIDRRNFLVEIIGADPGLGNALIKALQQVNYTVSVSVVTCDIEVALERHRTRDDHNISAYYAEAFHFRWIFDALRP